MALIDYGKLTKLYYSIGEVSELLGVTNSLIRYWESEFKSLKPKKNRKGDRQFTTKDIKVLESIYILVKQRGFTIEGARKELKGGSKKSSSSLQSLRDKLVQLKKDLEKLKRD